MKDWLETRWKVDAYPWIPGNPLFVIRFRRALATPRHREFIALSSVENSKIHRLADPLVSPPFLYAVIQLAFERKLQAWTERTFIP